MKKSLFARMAPWVRGVVAVCALLLSVLFAVRGEWLKAAVIALVGIGNLLMNRGK